MTTTSIHHLLLSPRSTKIYAPVAAPETSYTPIGAAAKWLRKGKGRSLHEVVVWITKFVEQFTYCWTKIQPHIKNLFQILSTGNGENISSKTVLKAFFTTIEDCNSNSRWYLTLCSTDFVFPLDSEKVTVVVGNGSTPAPSNSLRWLAAEAKEVAPLRRDWRPVVRKTKSPRQTFLLLQTWNLSVPWDLRHASVLKINKIEPKT